MYNNTTLPLQSIPTQNQIQFIWKSNELKLQKQNFDVLCLIKFKLRDVQFENEPN